MRIVILSIALLFCAFSAHSQVLKSAGVWYFLDVDSMTARPAVLPNGTELAYVIGTKTVYYWNRNTSTWTAYGSTFGRDSIYFDSSIVGSGTVGDPWGVDSTLFATIAGVSDSIAAALLDYVEIADTAAMLANYPSTAGYGIIDGGKTWRADTTSPSGLATRLFAKTLPTSIANTRIAVSDGNNLVGYPNLYYSSGTFINTTSLTGAVPLFSIFGDPGSGTGSVIQFLVQNTNTTSNKTEFKFGGATVARQWSFGTDINGTGENSFYVYANNTNKTPIFSTDAGNTLIGYSGTPNATNARYTLDVSGTDGINLPRGTTAQRPGVPSNTNPIRWNTNANGFEWYDGSKWNYIIPSSITTGTNKNIPYFNATSQLAQDNSFAYDVNVGQQTISKNYNGGAYYTAVNTQAASGAYTGIRLQTTGGVGSVSKLSATYGAYKNQAASDLTTYNTSGNISILNDAAGGNFNIAVGASTTAQMTLTSTGNLLLGTTTDVPTSILTARSTTKSSSPFPLHTLAESDAITGVQGNFDYETTQNGLRWHNGTRKAYALESTFARGTADYVPIINPNGQVTESTYFRYLTSTNVLNVGNVDIKISASNAGALTSVLIGQGTSGIQSVNIRGGAIGNGGVAIGLAATGGNGAIVLGTSSTSTTGIAIGTSGPNSVNGISIGEGASSTGYGIALGRRTVAPGTAYFVAGSHSAIGNGQQITEVFFGSGIQRGNSQSATSDGDGTAYTINGSGAFGANYAGGNIIIAGGKGTGTGTAGDVIFSTSNLGGSGSTLQSLTQRAWIKGNTGFVGIGTSSPSEQLHVNDDLRIGDSTRLTTTPAHSAITGLLTRDANGWVGAASLAGGLSYSAGVLTGANIYTANGTLPSGGARTINMQHSSKVYFQNDTNDKAFWTELYDVSGRSFQGTEVFNRHNGTSGELGMKHYAQTYTGLNRYTYFFNYTSTDLTDGSIYNQIANSRKASGLFTGLRNSNAEPVAGLFINSDSLLTSSTSQKAHFVGLTRTYNRLSSFGARVIDRSNKAKFMVQSSYGSTNTTAFNWIEVKNMDDDTTGNSVGLYEKYYFANATPGTGSNIHVWDNGTPSFVEVKRDTTIYINDADYDFSSAITTAQIASRYNRVIFWMTTTGAAGSDSEITLHTPDANLMQVEYLIHSVDEAGGFANVIRFGTNNAVDSTNGLVSSYFPAAGDGVHIRAGLRSGVYKYRYSI